jgi:hypothetical protein
MASMSFEGREKRKKKKESTANNKPSHQCCHRASNNTVKDGFELTGGAARKGSSISHMLMRALLMPTFL